MRPPVMVALGAATLTVVGWMVTSLMRSACVVKLAKSLGERRSNLRSVTVTVGFPVRGSVVSK